MVPVVAPITLGLTFILDVVATVLLVRSNAPTPLQKALQLVFIWAVPLVGPIVVIAILRETISIPRQRHESGSDNVWLPGIGPESDAFGSHHGGAGGDAGHGGDAGCGD